VRGNADLETVRAAIQKVEGVTDIVRLGRNGGRGRGGASA
jgi:GTP pyrophosphokinase